MEKYLIKNTTREERIKIVKNALAISISDSEIPDDDTLRIVKQYVDGNKELEEVQKEILERFKEND